MTEQNADGKWHARLARLFAASGRLAQACKHYDAALEALAKQQRVDRRDAEAAALLPDQYWKILFELATVKVQLQEHHHAIEMYRRIVANEPRFAEAHANLAGSHLCGVVVLNAAQLMIEGDLEGALQHCSEALSLAPEYREAHYNMNVLLRRAGRQQEAIDTYWTLMEQCIGRQIRPLSSRSNESVREASTPALADGGPPQERVRVSVICVKWGTKYGAEYVNRLYNSVTRRINSSKTLAIDFVCLTDDASGILAEGNLRCFPLEAGWQGWWNKIQVFSPQVSDSLHEQCIYIDLDTVVVGSIDELVAWSPPRGVMALLGTDAMANEQRQDGFNSSVMMWRNSREDDDDAASFATLYLLLNEHFRTVNKYIYKFDHWLKMTLSRVVFLDAVFPATIVEYKSLDESAAAPPERAAIVCFPLQPKPHDAKAAWIADHWH